LIAGLELGALTRVWAADAVDDVILGFTDEGQVLGSRGCVSECDEGGDEDGSERHLDGAVWLLTRTGGREGFVWEETSDLKARERIAIDFGMR